MKQRKRIGFWWLFCRKGRHVAAEYWSPDRMWWECVICGAHVVRKRE